MIAARYPDEFKDAIVRLLLAPGEQLISYCETYRAKFTTRVSNGRAKNVYVTSPGLDVALTNINVRWFTWQIQRVKTGFMKVQSRQIPQIASEGSIAVSKITSAKSSQSKLKPEIARDFRRRLGVDVGVCTFLTLNWDGGLLDQFSPFDTFPTLIKNLDLSRSGTALSSATSTVADAISRLAVLKSEGVLTDEEFDRAKSGFIGSTVEVVESSASLLRQLYALKQSGVLTESEFSIKKWDVLSHPR